MKEKHMRVRSGKVVITRSKTKPYKVVLLRDTQGKLEYPVGTIRQGEALIRSRLTTPSSSLGASGNAGAGLDHIQEYQDNRDSEKVMLRKRALSRWENEGGATKQRAIEAAAD